MKQYIVRQTIELALAVTAESEEQAYALAAKVPEDDWAKTAGDFEIDENETGTE